MRRTAKKTGLLITSAAAGLATLSQCNAGLLGDLFDKHADKNRNEVEKRMPIGDCSFGYFSTAWQPWGTCDQSSGADCSSENSRNSTPTILRGFQPGYSSGPIPNVMPSYGDNWNSYDNVLPQVSPDAIHGVPSSSDSSPAPILMTPSQAEPSTEFSSSPNLTSPQSVFTPPTANPFPRAITTNPELPTLNSNPYSNPGLEPIPGSSLPNAPQPQLNPGASVRLDPPQRSFSFPQTAPPQQSLPQTSPYSGSTGTGITLPPRRATSVTIDIPPGSAGTTLSLPDPARSGSNFGGAADSLRQGIPEDPKATRTVPSSGTPSATPGDAGRPLTPEPSLRPQPPIPMPSVVPGPNTTYRMPPLQTVPQFPAVQHANTQPVMRQYPTAPLQQFQTQQFQPATHWQAVPQQQPQQQTDWRVIPGAYPQQQPSIQQNAVQPSPQRPMLTPSERVIYLAPPPRR